VLEPAEFRIARIVGEQRARAREHIFRRVTASIPNGLAGTLEDLLVVKPDETSSGLQAIKANPSKPSVDAMLTLLDKLRVILFGSGRSVPCVAPITGGEDESTPANCMSR